jgi:phosphonoacetaldehyde hydrolase
MQNVIQLVVFDWAGTTVDHGCFAPVAAFMQSFKQHGVHVTSEEARVPMGLHKKDHIRTMLQMPGITARWKSQHGKDWTEADVQSIFEAFMPMQLEVLGQHSDLIPGLIETLAQLRSSNLKIAGTTGYFREAADSVAKAAAQQGYIPDINNCPEDVSAGRPAPWMIYRSMEKLGVYPPMNVIKVGDTIPDIEEGRNAGCWSVGVLRTSSEVGASLAEWEAMSPSLQDTKISRAKKVLTDAGAHFVIDSVNEVPKLITEINLRLSRGERP